MNVALKLKLINRIRDQLEQHVWNVFKKYITLHNINFNSPEEWIEKDGYIYFTGTDGCRGCYDSTSISIEDEWFIDYDKELANYKEKLRIKAEKEQAEIAKAREKNAVEKERRQQQQYLRLKKKYENK